MVAPGMRLLMYSFASRGVAGSCRPAITWVGTLMFGHRDPATGAAVYPALELVRLAIPRRVYTTEHMRYVAESMIELFRRRERLTGLRLTYEAPVLRHFTARLEALSDEAVPVSPRT